MNIYPVKTKIIMNDNIQAVITAICIREHDYISYEVSWWDNRTKQMAWVMESEFTADNKDKQSIGYLQFNKIKFDKTMADYFAKAFNKINNNKEVKTPECDLIHKTELPIDPNYKETAYTIKLSNDNIRILRKYYKHSQTSETLDLTMAIDDILSQIE